MPIGDYLADRVVAMSRQINRKKKIKPYDLKFFALELGGEVGEFQNIVKKLWRDGKTASPRRIAQLRKMMAEELVDIAMVLEVIIANEPDVNINAGVIAKMKKNKRRFKL